MTCNVASVRAFLSPEQNAKYKDYRIERWIAHKKGDRTEVLKTIANQCVNEDRISLIISDPKRRKATIDELSKRILHVIHAKKQHEVILYIKSPNQADRFNEEQQGDALLACMYYLLSKIEEWEGDGKQAICVIDMMEAASPKVSEVEGQMRMFSSIVGRSFPGTFSSVNLCCGWGMVARKAVSAVARGLGIQAEFITPKDLMNKIGKAYTPMHIGGEYNLDAGPSMDVLVMQHCASTDEKGKAVARNPSTPCANICRGTKWSTLTNRCLQVSKKETPSASKSPVALHVVGALGCSLLALLVGQYLSVLVILAVALFLHMNQGSSPSESPEDHLLRYTLEANYTECREILRTIAPHFNLLDMKKDDKAQLRRAALALTACLGSYQKERVKRCYTMVLDLCSMTAICPDTTILLAKWDSLFQYLSAMNHLQVPCVCGCNEKGDLDWLDAHFEGDNRRRRVVASHLQLATREGPADAAPGRSATTRNAAPPTNADSSSGPLTVPSSRHGQEHRRTLSDTVLSTGGRGSDPSPVRPPPFLSPREQREQDRERDRGKRTWKEEIGQRGEGLKDKWDRHVGLGQRRVGTPRESPTQPPAESKWWRQSSLLEEVREVKQNVSNGITQRFRSPS